jgi:hypothetical protein
MKVMCQKAGERKNNSDEIPEGTSQMKFAALCNAGAHPV